MSVGSGVPYNSHTGNGLSTAFAYGFTLLDEDDLVVTVAGVVTSAYTVTGVGIAAGGTVIFSSAPANGAAVLLRRVIQLVRATEYQTNGDLQAETVNGDFDRLWLAMQQGAADVSQAIRVPEIGALPALPAAASRASRLLGFDTAGQPVVVAPASGSASALALDLASKDTASKGVGQVGFSPTLAYPEGTAGRALGAREWSVTDYPWLAKFDGATDDGAAIQAAIDALAAAGGGRLVLPRGNAVHAAQLVLKNKVQLVGQGYLATRLTYTGTSDGVVIQNPLNSSTAACIHIEGIYFKATSAAANRGCLFDTGSSLVTVDRCLFETTTDSFGLILDQSELWTVSDCYFAGPGHGVWIINGQSRNAGSNTFFTNRIAFTACQFNLTGNAVVDDGGIDHSFLHCNWNAGSSWLRVCWVYGLNIIGGEFEVPTVAGIDFLTTRWTGATCPASNTVNIVGGAFYAAAAVPMLRWAVDSCLACVLQGVSFNTASAPLSGADNVGNLVATGNVQVGASTQELNNEYSGRFFAATWTGASSNPAIGNGTLLASVSRAGRRVTVDYLVTIGSTTTLGTGNWRLSLPVAPTGVDNVGSAILRCAGAIYSGVCEVDATNAWVLAFSSSNTTNAVQSTVPGAWSTGNSMKLTVSYLAAGKI